MTDMSPDAPRRSESPSAPAPDPGPADPAMATLPAEPGRRDYFPELDGLRFVAFALVYLFHQGIPQWSSWVRALLAPAERGLGRTLPTDLGARLQSNGWAGVQVFFVLSGFLITTLLLREERRYGRIDLRSFWARRILRIWPLYYLVLGLAMFALPWAEGALNSDSHIAFLRRQFPAFLAFLGNWSMGWLGPPPNDAISVLWSVCVEEQFYILCPLLLAFVPRRLRVPVLIGLVVVAVAARREMARHDVGPLLFQFNTVTHADALLSGVLTAFLVHRFGSHPGLRRLAAWAAWPVVMGFAWVLTRPDLAKGGIGSQTWDFVALWLAAAALIGVLALHRGPLNALLGYSRLVWLGKISYGLYMYHEIALWAGRRGFAAMGWFPNKEILQTIACFALTVGMAAASYYLFERPFLALKQAWARVPSRPV